jgi:DNA polymerase III alpha subunit (gram-positive type)
LGWSYDQPAFIKRRIDLDKYDVRDMYKEISPLVSGEYIIYDTETTGLSKVNDFIIQFSAIKFDKTEEKDRIDIYIKSIKAVSPEVSAINGITNEFLEEHGLDEDEAFNKIREFLGKHPVIAGYNNNSFDDKFMTSLYSLNGDSFEPAHSFDVIKIARKVIPSDTADIQVPQKNTGILKPSYTLEKVFHHFFPEEDPAFHSSIEDVQATARVLNELMRVTKDIVHDLETEDEEKLPAPGTKIYINRMWLFSKSQRMDRVYIATNYGLFYYDNVKDVWNGAKGAGSINNISVMELRERCLALTKTKNNAEFHKYFVDLEKKRQSE